MTDSDVTPQQTQFNVLLIGDDCVDVYQFGSVERISPEAPVPIFKYGRKEEVGGMARNVKRNLEELGCNVTYVCGWTSVKTRLIDSRSKQHILRVDNDAISPPLKFEEVAHGLVDADVVVISDYNKGFVSYELVEEIIDKFDGAVFIDTKKHDLARFQGAWVKVNQFEYSQLKSQCTGLIVTLGEEGAIVPHNNIKVPAPSVEVSDVCGAGDTFLSALAYKWCETSDILQAIKFAVRAGAITVQHLGNYAPTLKEIENDKT